MQRPGMPEEMIVGHRTDGDERVMVDLVATGAKRHPRQDIAMRVEKLLGRQILAQPQSFRANGMPRVVGVRAYIEQHGRRVGRLIRERAAHAHHEAEFGRVFSPRE